MIIKISKTKKGGKMTLKQISIFLENKPGHLSHACEVIAKAGINIITMTLADSSEFGILRIIVQNTEKGKTVLQNAGFTINLTEVIALEIDNKPGGLEKALKAAEAGDISIEYIYVAPSPSFDKARIIVRSNDISRALTAFKSAGVRILHENDFYNDKSPE